MRRRLERLRDELGGDDAERATATSSWAQLDDFLSHWDTRYLAYGVDDEVNDDDI